MALVAQLQVLALLAVARCASSVRLRAAGQLAAGSNGTGDDEGAWPRYPDRRVASLAGEWDFCFLPGIERVDPPLDFASACGPQAIERRRVPAVMHNPPPGEVPPQGTGVYAKDIELPSGRGGLLQFAGCAFTCRVYVDEQLLVDHQSGGYSLFWVKVPPSTSKVRRLLVLAERFWDPTITAVYWMNTEQDAEKGINVLRTAGGDMTHWGGLHRDVFLHELPNATWYVKRASIFPRKDLEKVHINLRLESWPGAEKRMAFGKKGDDIPVRLRFDGASEEQVVPARLVEKFGSLKLSDVEVPKARPWTPEAPNLHTVHISLEAKPGEASDSILVRFGLRRVEAKKEGLLLNGKRIVLKGVNRHSSTPASGSALTMEEIRRDVDLLQELGVNFVRGAHYQQDQRFLDLLDERGIMAWEEPLTWANSEDRLQDQKYQSEMMNAVKEMMDASANHPSVIIWGLFNEGPANSGTAACGTYQALTDKIKSRDGTRLVTWANALSYSINHGGADYCEKDVGADLVAFNAYPGWYSGPEECDLACIQEKWRRIVASERKKTWKPIIVSEFGAEGVWELKGQGGEPAPYTQEYQAQLLEASIGALSGIVDGMAVWQFSDIRGADANTDLTDWDRWRRGPSSLPSYYLRKPVDGKGVAKFMPRCRDPKGTFPDVVECGKVEFHSKDLWTAARNLRPKGMNNKGLVDFWRRKKLAFTVVQKAYAKI